MRHLRLLWNPGTTTPLSLAAREQETDLPILQHWPRDPKGQWEAWAPVPLFGRGVAQGLQGPALSVADREFVLAVLDALPAAAAVARQNGLVPEAQAGALHTSAVTLLRQAAKTTGSRRSRLRRVIRRLSARARSITASPSAHS